MNSLNHVAFIMDGNGRWGIKKKRSRNFGHLNGVNTVQKIVQASLKLKIPFLTFYVFSTENWRRPKTEITYLFNLITSYFNKEIKNVTESGIKIKILGNINLFSKKLKKKLKEVEKQTKNNKRIIVNLAINYGARDEIVTAVNNIREKKKITTSLINKNLYTKGIPNPDILIRTGDRNRLSNFMLWQLAYTEIFFIKKLWPDFNSADLKKIIKKYQDTQRNYGGI